MPRSRAKPTASTASRRTRWARFPLLWALGLPAVVFLAISSNISAVPDTPTGNVNGLDKLDAVDACKQAILARASHPSTVQFPMLDYDLRDDGAGSSVLLTTFTGKNGFGLELRFAAVCTFEGQRVSGVQIDESKE